MGALSFCTLKRQSRKIFVANGLIKSGKVPRTEILKSTSWTEENLYYQP
jgi:hypothetical protein